MSGVTTLPEVVVTAKPLPPLPAAPSPFTLGGGALFGRAWSLSVSIPTQAPTSPTIILSQSTDPNALHFTFEVTLHRLAVLGAEVLEARVYNVGSDMMAKIAQQYTWVTLSAGYVSTGMTTIFNGNVIYYEYGRDENMVDSVLVIHAQGSALPTLMRIINTTLPAGSTANAVVAACASAMQADGIGMGYCSDLGGAQSPRARTLFGNVRDILRDIAQSAGATAFIDSGNKLNILKQGDTLPGDTVVLNSKSGLIRIPTQTLQQGIQAIALIIPGLFPGRTVQINQAAINPVQRFLPDQSGAGVTTESTQAQVIQPYPIEQDGFYTTVAVTYTGDNRGNPWYAEMVLEPLDPTLRTGLTLETQ
jgi:hypothetical protein